MEAMMQSGMKRSGEVERAGSRQLERLARMERRPKVCKGGEAAESGVEGKEVAESGVEEREATKSRDEDREVAKSGVEVANEVGGPCAEVAKGNDVVNGAVTDMGGVEYPSIYFSTKLDDSNLNHLPV